MNKNNLRKCFEEAIEKGAKYLGVLVTVPEQHECEVIINHYNNFHNKLAYYEKSYNDNLTLNSFNEIRILNFAYGDSFAEIESKLI